jgi:hypothetical protein
MRHLCATHAPLFDLARAHAESCVGSTLPADLIIT